MYKEYEQWTHEFMEAWKQLDWEKVLTTLDENVKYYENPIDEPCKNFDEVIELWKIVEENQKDIEYKFNIVAFNDNTCIINWQMKRTMVKTNLEQEIDGIFQISLNEDNKCTFFKQWRFTR